YTTNAHLVRLTSVTDADGNSTQLYYEHGTFTNQVTKVVDPFSRTNRLLYDATSGYLTGIVDVVNMTNSFVYDAGARAGWVTNMVTPYGTTKFAFGGAYVDSTSLYSGGSGVSRYAEVTLPNNGKELYLFQGDCSGFISSSNWPTPVTAPLANTFDESSHGYYNSFYCSPLQYPHLSTSDPTALSTNDNFIARLPHGLAPLPTTALALERARSPDGATPGQVVRYDYDGKGEFHEQVGTNNLPSFVALFLPDGATRFTHYARGPHSEVTEE